MKIGNIRTHNYEIYILPNDTDEFEQLSIVNGLYNVKGGNHIQYIVDKIVPPIREKLQRKFKGIKPGDIKNKIKVVAIFRFFPNMEFNSQTKDFLDNNQKDVAEFLKDIDWNDVVKKILKNKELIESITEYFRIKEALREKQELKKAQTKKKKIVDDNYLPSIGSKKKLFLCEGLSAQASIANILGRKNNAFIAMSGVPMNIWNERVAKIANSKKFQLIADVIGIDYIEKCARSEFEDIYIATDADLPGIHIRGLLIAYFYKFASNLIKNKRLHFLKTPLVFAYDKKGHLKKFFFNFESFKEYEKENPNQVYEYTKGLGTLDKKLMKKLLEEYGFDYFVETITLDEETEDVLKIWFDNKNTGIRKEEVIKKPFNINSL